MAQAGYDPRAAVELWQNMQSAGGSPPAFLSTHPAPEQRIEQHPDRLPPQMPAPHGRDHLQHREPAGTSAGEDTVGDEVERRRELGERRLRRARH